MTITTTFNHQYCAICGSSAFAITSSGFTICRNCGGEQEVENMSSNLSCRDFTTQGAPKNHAILSKVTSTTIGNNRERYAVKFQKMQKVQERTIQVSGRYQRTIALEAYNEIMRICSAVGLSKEVAEKIEGYFPKIWNQTRRGSRERSVEVLVPVVIYRCTMVFNYSVSLKSILSHAMCSRHQFSAVSSSTRHLFATGDKYEFITTLIRKIIDGSSMPESVYDRAIQLLHASTKVSSTTIGVAAATCVAIAVLSLNMRELFPIYEIADKIHVSPSAIGNKILEIFCKKPGSMTSKKIYSIIPKVFSKLILACRKTRKMTSIQDSILSKIMNTAEEMKMAPDVRGRAIRILRTNLSTLAMTTPDVAAGVCLNMSVLSLQLITEYRIRSIAKILDISSSAITSCSYRVMKAHGFACDYRIYELEERIPHFYERIVGDLSPKKAKQKKSKSQ